jgi:hypothetical protein
MADLQNEHDRHALILRTLAPITLVGYAPRYFSSEFSKLMQSVAKDKIEVTVERVNLDAPLQYRVLCHLRAPWPANFQSCSTQEFRELAV